MNFLGKRLFRFFLPVLVLLLVPAFTLAATISFLVDPANIDTSPADDLITGNEFQPIGSDSTVFTSTPTNNLVGANRFRLSDTSGFPDVGGGGSTLSFAFSVNHAIVLEPDTLFRSLKLSQARQSGGQNGARHDIGARTMISQPSTVRDLRYGDS